MNEGKSAMTYSPAALANPFTDTRHISGVPGIAVRLGRALERWGRKVATPIDRETQRREYERHVGNEARMLQVERLARQPR